MQHLLQEETYKRNGDPAAKSHHDGLAPAFHQFYNIGIEPDGAHGHHDQELAQLIEIGKHGRRRSLHAAGAEAGDQCRENGRQYKI